MKRLALALAVVALSVADGDRGRRQRLFGGADDVLGRTIVLDDTPYTVVVVMPPGARRRS